MGWFILLALIALSLGALRLLGVRRAAFTASAAALLIGAAGYAFQGRPDMPSAPSQESEARDIFPLTQARHAFFGSFTPAESWLRMSEALARDGKSEDSVGILQNAVKRYPGDPQLWIGLGNALVDHARGMTPAAELARTDFAAYKRLADLPMAMTAHVVFSAFDAAQPATTSATMIEQVIRGAIGFQGLLMSDDVSMNALEGSIAERTRAIVAAGCDMVLHCNGRMEEMRQVAAETPVLSGEALARANRALALRKVPQPFDRVAGRKALDELIGRAGVVSV